MKGDFVIKFIEAIIETGKEMNEVWNWEPLYYKGIRVKGHNYNDFKKSYKGIKNLEQRGIINNISTSKLLKHFCLFSMSYKVSVRTLYKTLMILMKRLNTRFFTRFLTRSLSGSFNFDEGRVLYQFAELRVFF